MGQNPLNLALRFFLELAALFALGYWGWTQHSGAPRFLFGIGLPLLAAFIWGAFRVEGDGGKPLLRVPGIIRLLIEVIFFSAATWCLFEAGVPTLGWVFGVVTLLHYLVSYGRLAWLLKQ